MDQHPIPQDVTGFQFKLIGTMTVKQFGYVASGVIMAVILYYLPLKTPFALLIKLLFIPILGASGVVIAFVPIDGRPVDVMASNFMKALFSPNQYIYQRQGKKLSFSKIADAKLSTAVVTPAQKAAAAAAAAQHAALGSQADQKEEKLRAFLSNSQSKVKNDLDKKEAAFLSTLSIPSAAPVTAAPILKPAPMLASVPPVMPIKIPVLAPITTPAPVQAAPPQQRETNDTLESKETQLEQQLALAKQEESVNAAPPVLAAAHQKVTTLEKQIDEIHLQKQQLEQELSKLQTQLTQQKNPAAQTQPSQTAAPAPLAAPTAPVQDPQHVRTIPQEITKKAGLPHVSDTPNVVVGIVKDPRGNILSNILVEVKDKESNPVRAFKTNALGQFASATPLSPGTYTLELEDPKKLHRFDVIQITANNQIMLPIEVISHDAREELRQQLFAS